MATSSALTVAFLSTPLLFLSSRQRRRNTIISMSSFRRVSVVSMTARRSTVRRKNPNPLTSQSKTGAASEQIDNGVPSDAVRLDTNLADVNDNAFLQTSEGDDDDITAFASEDEEDAPFFFENLESEDDAVLNAEEDETNSKQAFWSSARRRPVSEDEDDDDESDGDSDEVEDEEELISTFAKRDGLGSDEVNEFDVADEFEDDDMSSDSSTAYAPPRRIIVDLDENDDIPDDDDDDRYYESMGSSMEYDDEVDGEEDDEEADDIEDVEEGDEDEEVDEDLVVDDDENEDDIRNAADILSDRGILSLDVKKGWQRGGSPVSNFALKEDVNNADSTDAHDDDFDDTAEQAALQIGDELEDDGDVEEEEDDDDDEDVLQKADDTSDIDDYPDLDEDEDDSGLATQGGVGRVWELCEDTYITITEPGESYGYELDEDDQEDQDMASMRRGKEGGWSGGLASYPSTDLQKGSKEWIARRTYELMTKASSRDLYRWSHRHLDPPSEIAALYPDEEPQPLPIGKGVFNATSLPSVLEMDSVESEDVVDDEIPEEELTADMEALKRSIKFPCSYKFKLEGDPGDKDLLPAIREVTEEVLNRKIPDSAFKIEEADSRFNHRVTIVVDVKNARQVTELYDALRSTPGVKYSYG